MKPDALVTMDRERTKFDFCSSCVFDRTCTGFWRTYVERHGTDEFQPVLTAPPGPFARLLRRVRRPPESPAG